MMMPRLSMYSKTAIDPSVLARIKASAAESSDDDGSSSSRRSDDESDVESDDYESTEFGVHSDDHEEDDKKRHQDLAKGETRAIQRLRVMFALVIVACTVLVAVGVYLYTSGSEQKSFEEAFSTDANKVLEAIGKTNKEGRERLRARQSI